MCDTRGGTFSPPGFGLRLGSKDARLVLEAAGQVNVLMLAANLVRDRLTAAINRGSWRIGLVGAGDRGVRGRRWGLTGISEQRCVVSAGF
ncbi:MAG TPA: hypothetical protein VFN75_02725 [Pseudonocardiaceae bacterium]|nr:hypothetical protein [Pseudonocardiaceae bacterium]